MTIKIIKLITVLLLSAITIQAQNLKSNPIPETNQQEIVESIIKKYGGKHFVRSGEMLFEKDPETKVIHVEGNWNSHRLIILEWNSTELLSIATTTWGR